MSIAIAGKIYFDDPRQAVVNDGALLDDVGWQASPTALSVTPRPGRLVIFPAWLQHQVRTVSESIHAMLIYNDLIAWVVVTGCADST